MMMEFAKWANETWQGNFTKEEVTENGRIYTAELKACKNGHVTETIQILLNMLRDEICDSDYPNEAKQWYERIIAEV